MQTLSSGWASFYVEVAMSELCLDCLSKMDGKRYRPSSVILGDDWCEECCQYKPCVIRFRKPWERIKYFFGIRERELSEEEWAELEEEEDARFARMMDEFMDSEGKRYEAENERLKDDPDAAVPIAIEKRAIERIENSFSASSNEKSS